MMDSEGKGGGLVLMWKREVNLSILNFSKFHVHVVINNERINRQDWFLIETYGHPVMTKELKHGTLFDP